MHDFASALRILRARWEESPGALTVTYLDSRDPRLGGRLLEELKATSDPKVRIFYQPAQGVPVAPPYFPFLEPLFQTSAGELRIPDLLATAGVYDAHRQVLENFLTGRKTIRQEELIIEETAFEQEEMRKNILKLLSVLAPGQPLVFLLEGLENWGPSVFDLLQYLNRVSLAKPLHFVILLDSHRILGEEASQEPLRRLVGEILATPLVYSVESLDRPTESSRISLGRCRRAQRPWSIYGTSSASTKR